jgi:hypothetical protein
MEWMRGNLVKLILSQGVSAMGFFFFISKIRERENRQSEPKPPKKERWKIGLPEIGEVFYFPIEHIYYDERQLPREEYLIVDAKVTGYYRDGYTEIRLSDGKTPRYFKKDAVEKRIFRNRDDAIGYAEKLADHYDSVWEKMEGKMRRGWRNEKK